MKDSSAGVTSGIVLINKADAPVGFLVDSKSYSLEPTYYQAFRGASTGTVSFDRGTGETTKYQVAAGSYEFTNTLVSYALGAQRRVSGTLSAQSGSFYSGTLIAVGYSAARVSVMKQFSFEPTISINRVETPGSTVTTQLYRTRADYGFSPLMFASALLQYSSSDRTFSSNLRFRWEYRPGSELFVVYTDERDLTDPRFALPTQVLGLRNRAFVVKINRLLRF